MNGWMDFSQFRWEWIAEKYIAHYKDILGLPDVDKLLLQSYVPVTLNNEHPWAVLLIFQRRYTSWAK